MNHVREALAKLLKPGERLCNCGCAFYTRKGPEDRVAQRNDGDGWKWVETYVCEHGCGCAQIVATERLAKAFLATGNTNLGDNDGK